MKLSIITINYNNSDGLKATISSVSNQNSRNDFEYIVIDGASKDGSKDVIDAAKGSIDFAVSEPDKGIYNAMNKGVRHATGDYCLFLNSGDCLHDDNTIAEILPHLGGDDLVIGKTMFLNNMSTSVVEAPITMRRLYVGSLPHPATFIKTDLLRGNPYDESLKIVSDWKFFLQEVILNNCSYKIIDTIVSDFDCEGISSQNRDLCATEREKVLKELFPERILLDYFKDTHGQGYEDSPYDKFFIKLRDYNYGKVIYTLSVLLMKFVAIFRKGARFSRNYPNKLS